VGKQTAHFANVVSLMVLCAVTAIHDDSVVWQAWTGIHLSPLKFVLLAGFLVALLADLWVHACCDPRRGVPDQHSGLALHMAAVPIELRVQRHV
jgi:hypothetical protein